MTSIERKNEELLRRELGERIARAIKASGKSQGAVADSANIDRGSFSKILHGERRPSIGQLRAIALALNLAASDFLDEDDSTGAAPTAIDPVLAACLARWGDRIAPAVRRHLERSHFSTDEGVVLDEDFWREQAAIWIKRLGLPSGGVDSGEPTKKS